MAVPNDRRVIYGTHVVPQEAILREDSVDEIYKLDATVAKRFGGKGIVASTEDQTIDGWVSFMSPVDDVWESRSVASEDLWEETHTVWDRGGRNITDTLAVIHTGSTAIKFLYIKNLGSVECEVALEGDERDILIPAGAAISMRTHTTVTAATVKVATAASSGNTTQIEYVIAI